MNGYALGDQKNNQLVKFWRDMVSGNLENPACEAGLTLFFSFFSFFTFFQFSLKYKKKAHREEKRDRFNRSRDTL